MYDFHFLYSITGGVVIHTLLCVTPSGVELGILHNYLIIIRQLPVFNHFPYLILINGVNNPPISTVLKVSDFVLKIGFQNMEIGLLLKIEGCE